MPTAAPVAQALPLADYVRRAGHFGFSGAALASSEQHILVEQAAGFADIRAARANEIGTLFDIGSLSKQFTAAAVLKLEEDGALLTSDTLGRFFQDLPDNVAGLTLHQVLTHSSGLPWDIADPKLPLTKEQFFNRLRNAKLEFQPGARYAYSNVGYTLLAAVVEKAAGTNFETFSGSGCSPPRG